MVLVEGGGSGGFLVHHELGAVADEGIDEPIVDEIGPMGEGLLLFEFVLGGLELVLEFLVQFLLVVGFLVLAGDALGGDAAAGGEESG